MPSATVTVSSATTSIVIPMNLRRYKQGVGLLVTLSAGATLTATVQVTGDDIKDEDFTAATAHWNSHDTLVNLTASANGNLAFPVTAVRLNCTAWTSGTVTLSMVQAED